MLPSPPAVSLLRLRGAERLRPLHPLLGSVLAVDDCIGYLVERGAPERRSRCAGALNSAGVRYLIVGGLAVNAHGYVRLTRDIDIVLALDEANAARGVTSLINVGYRWLSRSPQNSSLTLACVRSGELKRT